MGKAEAVPTFGWLTWMHHARREQHSHVVEIINPGNAVASPADIDKYVLRGQPGEFVMEVSFHGKPADAARLRHRSGSAAYRRTPRSPSQLSHRLAGRRTSPVMSPTAASGASRSVLMTTS